MAQQWNACFDAVDRWCKRSWRVAGIDVAANLKQFFDACASIGEREMAASPFCYK